MIKSKYNYIYVLFILFAFGMLLISCNRNQISNPANTDIVNMENTEDIAFTETSDPSDETNDEEGLIYEQGSPLESVDMKQASCLDTFYTNRTSASRMYQDDNIIYYSNVYDNK